MLRPLERLTDLDLTTELAARGYIVKHKSEASRTRSWHHMEPVPADFEARAIEELRKQIVPELVDFETRAMVDGRKCRSAYLRIL